MTLITTCGIIIHLSGMETKNISVNIVVSLANHRLPARIAERQSNELRHLFRLPEMQPAPNRIPERLDGQRREGRSREPRPADRRRAEAERTRVGLPDSQRRTVSNAVEERGGRP